MADLLEWHRRDAKPGWWRFFHLHDLTDDELLGESDAIAGLKLEGTIGEVKRSYIVRYRFPPQEHPFGQGDQAVDPRSGKQWTIHQVDDAAGTLDLRRGKDNTSPHPVVLVEPGPIDTRQPPRPPSRSRSRRRCARRGGMGSRAGTRPPSAATSPTGYCSEWQPETARRGSRRCWAPSRRRPH